ncbi:MAG: glycosyltransferase family 2 protein [bacterium]
MRSHDGRKIPNPPRVSVVTPSWNGLSHLEPCYRSLRQLDYPPESLELILVDNGSTDGSIRFMQQHFPEVKIVRNSTNLGFCKANNQGAQAAQGEYVAFLNNDTRVHPAWLQELVAAVRDDPEVVCAGSKLLNWEGDRLDFAGGSVSFHGSGFQPGHGSSRVDPFSENRPVLFACGGSMLIDRQVFLDCGGFDEDFFAYLEDVDLGWRLWLLGYKVVLVPTAITYHRFRGTTRRLSRPRVVALTERNALMLIMKNYDDENLAHILPAALLLMMERAFISSDADRQRYKLDGLQREAVHYAAEPGPLMGGDARQKSRSAREVIGQEGAWTAAGRAATKAWRVLCRWFIRRFNSELEAVPKLTLSYFVAADDVLESLPRVMEKRAEIQQRRKRSDAQICHLFEEPFRSDFHSVRYKRLQDQLIQLFDIREVFRPSK